MRNIIQDTQFRRLLCLVLCIATWRGPVVWVHSHSDHEASEAADVRLSSHLRRFHHHPSHSDGSSKWHLHFGLLRDLIADNFGNECPASEPIADDPISLTSAVCTVTQAATSSEASVDVVWFAPFPPRPSLHSPAAVPRGSFLQSYGTAPLRTLTRVIRC
jgi:hypothetical protein